MSAAPKLDLPPQERRRHARVKVDVKGRLMLEDKQEYPCEAVNISPGGILLRTTGKGRTTEKVIAYLDYLGRIEGVIVRSTASGFALKLALTPMKRDRVADLLTWLVNRPAFGDAGDRRHDRIVPYNLDTVLQIEAGLALPARIIDISISGAGVSVENQPSIGSRVLVGNTPGKIVRHLPEGVAVEFLRLVPSETFDEDIIL